MTSVMQLISVSFYLRILSVLICGEGEKNILKLYGRKLSILDYSAFFISDSLSGEWIQ